MVLRYCCPRVIYWRENSRLGSVCGRIRVSIDIFRTENWKKFLDNTEIYFVLFIGFSIKNVIFYWLKKYRMSIVII